MHIVKSFAIQKFMSKARSLFLFRMVSYDGHLARVSHHHRRCCCSCLYAPTSNTASHNNQEKINSYVSFCFLYKRKEKNWRADINEISQDMEISHLARFSLLALFFFSRSSGAC